jgi:regulatory protein
VNENKDEMHVSAAKINQVCIGLLSRREHSQKELLNKLLEKGYSKDVILLVIEDLVLQGWQCDARYAESYARYRIQKGYGPLWITYELKKKGIDAFVLDEVILKASGSWMELLEQVYIKKYGYELLMDRQEWARRSRFLLHRGFSGAMISALLDHLNIKL